MPSIDVILPLYRPKNGWELHVMESMRLLREYFGTENDLRFLLVNDGSGSSFFPEEILNKLSAVADGKFRYLSYECNRGKGYSLRFAVREAHADFIFYTDGDFPFGWKGIADAYSALEQGADVVMGVRDSGYAAALSPMRKFLSRNVRRMNRILLGLPDRYLDTQAGLKGFNQQGRRAFLATKTDTFLFDTEFILLAWKNKFRIDTVPLSLRPGLHFSRMGLRVMMRELRHFLRILLTIRFAAKAALPEPEK